MCDDGDGDGISLSSPIQSSPVQSNPVVCLVELVDGASESVLLISSSYLTYRIATCMY